VKVCRHHGTIDIYRGECITPFQGRRCPTAATPATAHSLASRCRRTMNEMQDYFGPRPETRIVRGLNSGRMSGGHRGARVRLAYTVRELR